MLCVQERLSNYDQEGRPQWIKMLAPVLNLFCVSPLPQDFSDAPNRSGTDFLALDVGLGAETRFH